MEPPYGGIDPGIGGAESRYGGIYPGIGGAESWYGGIYPGIGGAESRFGGIYPGFGGTESRYGGIYPGIGGAESRYGGIYPGFGGAEKGMNRPGWVLRRVVQAASGCREGAFAGKGWAGGGKAVAGGMEAETRVFSTPAALSKTYRIKVFFLASHRARVQKSSCPSTKNNQGSNPDETCPVESSDSMMAGGSMQDIDSISRPLRRRS